MRDWEGIVFLVDTLLIVESGCRSLVVAMLAPRKMVVTPVGGAVGVWESVGIPVVVFGDACHGLERSGDH